MNRTRRFAVCAAASIATALGAVVAPATASAAPVAAAPQPATVVVASALAKPSVRANVRTATMDQNVTFTGKAPANANVVVQYAVGRNWRALPGRVKANRAGDYRIAVKHPLAGRVVYRVVATVGKGSAFSNSVAIAAPPVARWYWLANYQRAASNRQELSATLELAGQTFQYGIASIIWGYSSSSTYRINGTCSRLTAFAGTQQWDTTRWKGKQLLQVIGDGDPLFTAELGSLEGRPVDVSLRGAQRLTLANTLRGADEARTAGFGAARVLCTSPPGVLDPVD